MICALSWSGGKDAMLALDRAARDGLDVRYLFNIYEGTTGLVRFHGVPAELIAAQARLLGRELIQDFTHPDGYEAVLDRILEQLRERGVEAILFGNIHLTEIRDWYAERLRRWGLQHIEPLWREAPRSLVREILARGYRTRITSVNLEIGRPEWLGRDMTSELLAEIVAAGADPAGERGEYHSFVYDGPLFSGALRFEVSGEWEMEGHRFLALSSEL